MNKQNFKIIIGLGNPGQEYRRTYHNAGSMFIDYLAEYFSPNEPFKKPRFKNFEFINNDKSIIVKTLAFMNLSGGSVLSALKYFSAGKSAIKPEEILIAHDDVDIELGKYKFDMDRGSAGHRGIESIIKSLGTKNFGRLRIGIGLPNRLKADSYVLNTINKKNLEIINQTFDQIISQLFQSASN